MDKIKKLIDMINECNNIVAFTGAGVSTDSGIKDFRGSNGLYKQKYKYPAEYMLSKSCFNNNTLEFYQYYKDNFNCLDIKPNNTHFLFKKLEDSGKLKCIITQNIDGLHTKAGCKNVYEIHGTIYKNYCTKCKKMFDASYVFNSSKIPKCKCGGIIKPNVVLYEEQLPDKELMASIKAIEGCEMLIVAGSSLTVYPACNLINYFNGKYLIIINNDITSYDKKADLVINDNLAKVSKMVMNNLIV